MPNIKEYNFRTKRFSDLPLTWEDHKAAYNYLKRVVNPGSKFFDFIDQRLNFNQIELKVWQKTGLIGLRLLTIATTSESSIFQQNSDYFYPGTTIPAPAYITTFDTADGNKLRLVASNEHALLIKSSSLDNGQTTREIYKICLPVGNKIEKSHSVLTLYAGYTPSGRKYGLSYYPLNPNQRNSITIDNFISTVTMGIRELVTTIPGKRQRPIGGIGNYF